MAIITHSRLPFVLVQMLSDGKVNKEEFADYEPMADLFVKIEPEVLETCWVGMFHWHENKLHMLRINNTYAYKGGSLLFSPFVYHTENRKEAAVPFSEWQYSDKWLDGSKEYKVPVYNATFDDDVFAAGTPETFTKAGNVYLSAKANGIQDAYNKMLTRKFTNALFSDGSVLRFYWDNDALHVRKPIITKGFNQQAYQQLIPTLMDEFDNCEEIGDTHKFSN